MGLVEKIRGFLFNVSLPRENKPWEKREVVADARRILTFRLMTKAHLEKMYKIAVEQAQVDYEDPMTLPIDYREVRVGAYYIEQGAKKRGIPLIPINVREKVYISDIVSKEDLHPKRPPRGLTIYRD